ncbi:MAG TPA: M23 family metallopeptidase [Sphingobium sp.]|nr:M23 family metallopeptidase [Sphingobium sp.]
MSGIIARLAAMMPEREIFVRAGGTVRFILITRRMQLGALALLAALVLVWAMGIGVTLWRQASVVAAQASLAEQRSNVSSEAARASAERQSVDAVARELEQRQDALDALMDSHFGKDVDQTRVVGQGPTAAAQPNASERFALIRERQEMFARTLTRAAETRLAKLEAAIRGVGLNPAQLARGAQGGPFVPAGQLGIMDKDANLRSLFNLLGRLSMLEAAFTVLPSGRPTLSPMMTSTYGYRRDPFNGMPAFHAGVDFPGAHGQPILAASSGRVVFAGRKSGYGNCIEIDHGHAIITRYAHLAGFGARPGQMVQRGQQIGRMGSTGRSTGTHLHFEVRVNGAAVNPRPFLEARQDVLETGEAGIGATQRASNRG